MNKFIQSNGFKRLIILISIAAVLYLMRSMMNLILITFIFTFLMHQLSSITTKGLRRVIPVNERAVVVTLYLLLISGLVAVLYKYLPLVTWQITQLVDLITGFKDSPQDNSIMSYLATVFQKFELDKYLEQGFNLLLKNITSIGKISMQVFMALILSLFVLLEKSRIIEFTAKFHDSKIGPFYDELAFFCKKFVRSFGKVIEAQFVIAIVNCVLSVIVLWIMGFPQLIALGIMIFLLGLIPVAGVIISLIPLSIIAYSIGGFAYIVYVLIFVAVLHALEAYLLNPKLMSAKTDLPIFYTFVVLIFAEHFLGGWGLIIGIPIFMFLLDVLDVLPSKDEKLT